MKLIKIINLALILSIIVLSVNLVFLSGIGIKPNEINNEFEKLQGALAYNLDTGDPVCYFSNSGELNEIPIGRCCLEVQKQLACKPIDSEKFDLRCFVSETSERFYLINQKTLNYCEKEGYHVKIQ